MRIGNPQAGQSFWIGHSTVSRSGRSRCEILAICGSSCSEDGRSHHDFQTARFAGLEKKRYDRGEGRTAKCWSRLMPRLWGENRTPPKRLRGRIYVPLLSKRLTRSCPPRFSREYFLVILPRVAAHDHPTADRSESSGDRPLHRRAVL